VWEATEGIWLDRCLTGVGERRFGLFENAAELEVGRGETS